MNRKVEILKAMMAAKDIEELKIVSDYSKVETTATFCFYYIEFLPDEAFFREVFPETKRFSVDGLDDESGRAMMTLVFDGVLNKGVS